MIAVRRKPPAANEATDVDRLEAVLRKHIRPMTKKDLMEAAGVTSTAFNKAVHLLNTKLEATGELVHASRASGKLRVWVYTIATRTNALREKLLGIAE